jgi:rod shape-determining protein MreD
MLLLTYFLFITLLFALQTTVLDMISIFGVTPDLALIFAIFCGMNLPGTGGALMGTLLGFIQDCLSGDLLGVNTLSKGLICFFISSLKDKIILENFIPISLFMAVAAFFDGMIYYMVTAMLLKGEGYKEFLYSTLPLYIVYNAVAGPAMFAFLKFNKRRFFPEAPSRFSGLS